MTHRSYGNSVAVMPASPISSSSGTACPPSACSTSSASAKPTSKIITRGNAAIPHDKVRLDVLLISGQRKYFLFDPADTVRGVRDAIWEAWPEDWPPRPMSSAAMRILHLGHILDDKTVLCSAKAYEQAVPGAMVPGRSSVVHLLIRQEQAKDEKDDDSPKSQMKKSNVDEEESAGCCNCVIC